MCAVPLFMGLTPLLLYLTHFGVSRCFFLIFQGFFTFSILYYRKYNLPSIYSSIAKSGNKKHKKEPAFASSFYYNYSSISSSSSNSSTSSTSTSSISKSSTISSTNSSAVASAVIASNSASTSSFTSW